MNNNVLLNVATNNFSCNLLIIDMLMFNILNNDQYFYFTMWPLLGQKQKIASETALTSSYI